MFEFQVLKIGGPSPVGRFLIYAPARPLSNRRNTRKRTNSKVFMIWLHDADSLQN
jgi:hypothetical protein